MEQPPPPESLLAIAGRVEQRIDDLLTAEIARWSPVDPQLGEPIACLKDMLLSGGKRLRPAFCHWAYVGAGGTDEALVVDVGAALELLHGFALVHDDVMDGSDRRRGLRTAHRIFEDRHVVEGWRAESRRFGEGVAILIGDLAFVYADTLLTSIPTPARRVWDELRIEEPNIGQYLDLLGTAQGDADLATARRIATYKSGKYTVERPLHLGAALAGRLDKLAAPLTAYGIPLGEAFQLRDDLLGAFGDADILGKPVGDDLREGKPTLLATARERATGAGAATLQRVGDPELGAEGVAAVQEVLVATGAAEEIERRIAALTEQAVGAAQVLPVGEEARAELADLAAYVAWRDR